MKTCNNQLFLVLTFFVLIFQFSAQGQTDPRLTEIRANLQAMEVESPGLAEETELSVSGVPIDEFLRALAKNHKLNLSIAEGLTDPITNNFSNITVGDILYFLAESYSLDYRFTANIIRVSRYEIPKDTTAYEPKALHIVRDSLTHVLDVDFRQDSIHLVTRQLTQITGENIVYDPALSGKRLTLYLEDAHLNKVLEQLAFANQMSVEYAEDSVYRLLPRQTNSNNTTTPSRRKNTSAKISFIHNNDSTYSLQALNRPLSEIVQVVFSELQEDYFYYSEPQGNITVQAIEEPLESILQKLFNGTAYTYRKMNGAYYLGERTLEGLRATQRLHMKYRSVEKLNTLIPANLTKDLQVVEFPELNSLIVSGSYPQIQELSAYLKEIDKPVPVIQIEVLIIDFNRNHNINTGIEMGIGEKPAKSGGTINPGIDYTLNAQSVNRIIAGFNGFGSLNLGPVTPNFYVSLRALETNGVIKTRSTPRLATLNGHEANINIGRTEYYVVENQSLQGVQNPIPIVTRNYQSVNADFNLKIKPFVSGEGHVTLEITVEQSDFTARIAPDAPPGQVKRTFTTMIRVMNEDMILIGGLEEKTTEETGSGLPWISRVPIIKWFFSSKSKRKEDNRLNIFIKPTIFQ